MTAPSPVDGGAAKVSLYREIDALGGAVESEWDQGYAQALTDVLAILNRRGFGGLDPYGPHIDGLTLMQWSNRLYELGQSMPGEVRERFKGQLGAFQDRLALVLAERAK